MVDTCTVTRLTDQAFDDTDGSYSDTTSEIYSGVCRVQAIRSLLSTEADAAGRVVTTVTATVQLPEATTGVQVDDVVTVDTSQGSGVAGRVFRVRQVEHKTHASMRRLTVEEEQS